MEFKMTWRKGMSTPEFILGSAAVHGNIVYFSVGLGSNVYSYSLSEDKWTKLPQNDLKGYALAMVNGRLTTIGGHASIHAGKYEGVTDTLLCLSDEVKWVELLPPMPTKRTHMGAVATPTHLVVAGGQMNHVFEGVTAVEVLDLNTFQWSSASSLPEALERPHIKFCQEHLYYSEHNTVFSCSMGELLKSCKPPSTNSSDGGSVWTRLADIPVPYWASLATLKGHVLAIGGCDTFDGKNPTRAIHCYNRSTESWNVIGEMPTPRHHTVVAVLQPSDEMMVVGGWQSKVNEIAKFIFKK